MRGLRESDLVAVAMPPGPAWLEVLSWECALLPVGSASPSVLSACRPTAVWDGTSLSVRSDGVPVADGVGVVIATSGSSGAPRAVSLGRSAVEAAVAASVRQLACASDDPWLSCLPLSHMGGLLVLLRALSLGAPVEFSRALVEGPRFASVVPTQLVRALAADADLAGYRAILVGGAALDPAVAARAPVVTTYGLTETCGGVVYDGVPLDGVSVRVAEDDEIQVRGPTLMRGYRLDDEATARAFTSDGWLRTRDAGSLVDGRLVVHGRLDDVIITGGEKVWPDLVERVLRAHPSVDDAAVVGVKDPEWGARVVAHVVVSGDSSPSLEELRDHVGSHLPRFAAPRELVLHAELPRTEAGKVARGALARGEA